MERDRRLLSRPNISAPPIPLRLCVNPAKKSPRLRASARTLNRLPSQKYLPRIKPPVWVEGVLYPPHQRDRFFPMFGEHRVPLA